MKLKSASKIEKAINLCFSLVIIPFVLLYMILFLAIKPVKFIIDWNGIMVHRIGNWLLRSSKEVRDGKVKNPQIIKSFTAISAYEYIEERKKSNH